MQDLHLRKRIFIFEPEYVPRTYLWAVHVYESMYDVVKGW